MGWLLCFSVFLKIQSCQIIEIQWLSLFYYYRKCLALPPSRPIGGKEGVGRWGGCCSVVFFQQPKLSSYGIVEMPWLSLFTSKEMLDSPQSGPIGGKEGVVRWGGAIITSPA